MGDYHTMQRRQLLRILMSYYDSPTSDNRTRRQVLKVSKLRCVSCRNNTALWSQFTRENLTVDCLISGLFCACFTSEALLYHSFTSEALLYHSFTSEALLYHSFTSEALLYHSFTTV